MQLYADKSTPFLPLPPIPVCFRRHHLFFNRSRTSLIAARPKEPVHRWLLDYIPVYPTPEGRQGDLRFPAYYRADVSRDYHSYSRWRSISLAEYAALYDKMYGDNYNNNIMDLIIYKYIYIYACPFAMWTIA